MSYISPSYAQMINAGIISPSDLQGTIREFDNANFSNVKQVGYDGFYRSGTTQITKKKTDWRNWALIGILGGIGLTGILAAKKYNLIPTKMFKSMWNGVCSCTKSLFKK